MDEIEAESDNVAVRLAREWGQAGTVEVWNGDRRVRTVATIRAAGRSIA
jgi:hypothetical protein